MKRLIGTLISTWIGFAPAVIASTPSAPSAKTVAYNERDVVPIKAKIRFTTLIVLPKQEQILDFTCGDKEFWIVNGSQNFAYVKPAKADSRTNLNLITASGNVYSFVLTEISDSPNSEPDLKIFIEPKDESMVAAANGQPRFVPAQQVEDYRQQVEIAKTEAREAKQAAQTAVERDTGQFRSQYPASLKFPYRIETEKKPFNVTAMFTDGKFTFIQAHPDEPPALYELKDGKPDLIHFDFRDGTYIASRFSIAVISRLVSRS
jgi:type IV secretion system protein VirB9